MSEQNLYEELYVNKYIRDSGFIDWAIDYIGSGYNYVRNNYSNRYFEFTLSNDVKYNFRLGLEILTLYLYPELYGELDEYILQGYSHYKEEIKTEIKNIFLRELENYKNEYFNDPRVGRLYKEKFLLVLISAGRISSDVYRDPGYSGIPDFINSPEDAVNCFTQFWIVRGYKNFDPSTSDFNWQRYLENGYHNNPITPWTEVYKNSKRDIVFYDEDGSSKYYSSVGFSKLEQLLNTKNLNDYSYCTIPFIQRLVDASFEWYATQEKRIYKFIFEDRQGKVELTTDNNYSIYHIPIKDKNNNYYNNIETFLGRDLLDNNAFKDSSLSLYFGWNSTPGIGADVNIVDTYFSSTYAKESITEEELDLNYTIRFEYSGPEQLYVNDSILNYQHMMLAYLDFENQDGSTYSIRIKNFTFSKDKIEKGNNNIIIGIGQCGEYGEYTININGIFNPDDYDITVVSDPDVNTWNTFFEPFEISLIAFDDNKNRILNDQFYIKYAITYDNTIPNIKNNYEIIYSNKDGIIKLNINKACRISIDAYGIPIYNKNITDTLEEEYKVKHICENLIIPLEAFITSFTAKYISDLSIAVNSNVPRKYVQIFITKSNNTTVKFTLESDAYNDYVLTPNIITHIEDNTIQVSYNDPILNKIWTSDIIVYGKAQELALEAIYVGITIDTDGDGRADRIRDKQLNNLVSKSEILVTLLLYDGYEESRKFLTNEEWEFVTFPQITNLNLGIFEIMRNNLRCQVKVPFLWLPINSRIDVWYEGYPVRVGEKIIPENFRIYLYKPNDNRELIPFDQCQIYPNDFIIHNVGANWFTVRYKFDNFTISDKVAIIGYKDNTYPGNDFELLYYNPNINSLENVTEIFDEACTTAGVRYFNWEKILDMVIKTGKYGQYKLYAPVLTGLSTRSDTEWLITCMYEKGLSAQLNKLILKKEEQTNGEEEGN